MIRCVQYEYRMFKLQWTNHTGNTWIRKPSAFCLLYLNIFALGAVRSIDRWSFIIFRACEVFQHLLFRRCLHCGVAAVRDAPSLTNVAFIDFSKAKRTRPRIAECVFKQGHSA